MAIQEHTLELAIIELNRCLKALKALADHEWHLKYNRRKMTDFQASMPDSAKAQLQRDIHYAARDRKLSAAALRASMDATRILADLRQGR